MPYTPPDSGSSDDIGESREELQVRLAAQRILSDHLNRDSDEFGTASPTFWSNMDLDLTNATLINLDFHGRHLRQAALDGARFFGNARFDGATFTRGATFHSAEFTGDAWFDQADFRGDCVFDEVRFAQRTSFTDAQFLERARFERAKFPRITTFAGAQVVQGAVLDRAHAQTGGPMPEVATWPPGWKAGSGGYLFST